jgi:hypothetical protein
MATNVICSVCGKPYLAYSSRSTINYKLRHGKPLICPYCMRAKRQAGALRSAQLNREKHAKNSQPLQAPCGSMIVPGHKRCPQEFYCEHYGHYPGPEARGVGRNNESRQPGNQDRGYQPEIYRAGWIDQGGMRCSRQGKAGLGKARRG